MFFKTEQERFWHGDFGDEYAERNADARLVVNNSALFAKIFARVAPIRSLIEFGANIGLNIQALHWLFPRLELSAIEINEKAAEKLRALGYVRSVYQQSILDFAPERAWDMALIKGVLIHIAPAELPAVYDKLHAAARRYSLLCEYYNPVPVAVNYRGYEGKLFKRDFAGELLDRFSDLALLDYGFAYHRDNYFPHDDGNWFLLEKRRAE
jgi:spore coat polysaccharide biosynthesis protein SpsF